MRVKKSMKLKVGALYKTRCVLYSTDPKIKKITIPAGEVVLLIKDKGFVLPPAKVRVADHFEPAVWKEYYISILWREKVCEMFFWTLEEEFGRDVFKPL